MNDTERTAAKILHDLEERSALGPAQKSILIQNHISERVEEARDQICFMLYSRLQVEKVYRLEAKVPAPESLYFSRALEELIEFIKSSPV